MEHGHEDAYQQEDEVGVGDTGLDGDNRTGG